MRIGTLVFKGYTILLSSPAFFKFICAFYLTSFAECAKISM